MFGDGFVSPLFVNFLSSSWGWGGEKGLLNPLSCREKMVLSAGAFSPGKRIGFDDRGHGLCFAFYFKR